MPLAKKLERALRHAGEITLSRLRGGPHCGVCGFKGHPRHRQVLWPELIAEWELTEQWAQWMDQREGNHCAQCGSSLRSGQLAEAIVSATNASCGTTATHLSQLFQDARARDLSIAEINSAGDLHRFLAPCPGLRYSEFGSQLPGIPSEDLMRLSYVDSSFDLVITSDTLEHVPDIDIALREIHRVLKPGAAHVFSVPVISDRPTRCRALLEGDKLTHLLPPSFHGAPEQGKLDFLVFYEFGGDFEAMSVNAGFEMTTLRNELNPTLVTFIGRRRK